MQQTETFKKGNGSTGLLTRASSTCSSSQSESQSRMIVQEQVSGRIEKLFEHRIPGFRGIREAQTDILKVKLGVLTQPINSDQIMVGWQDDYHMCLVSPNLLKRLSMINGKLIWIQRSQNSQIRILLRTVSCQEKDPELVNRVLVSPSVAAVLGLEVLNNLRSLSNLDAKWILCNDYVEIGKFEQGIQYEGKCMDIKTCAKEQVSVPVASKVVLSCVRQTPSDFQRFFDCYNPFKRPKNIKSLDLVTKDDDDDREDKHPIEEVNLLAKEFFSREMRLTHLGQIFTFVIDPNRGRSPFHELAGMNNVTNLAWKFETSQFLSVKIVDCKPKFGLSLLIDPDNTETLLSGYTNAFIPPFQKQFSFLMYNSSSNSSDQQLLRNVEIPHPDFLFNEGTAKLQSLLIQLFKIDIQDSQQNFSSISPLLYDGDEVSCKQCMDLITWSCGVGLVEVDFRGSLSSQEDSKPLINQLRDAYIYAKTVSPCILFLQNLDALSKSTRDTNMLDIFDERVASVIRQFQGTQVSSGDEKLDTVLCCDVVDMESSNLNSKKLQQLKNQSYPIVIVGYANDVKDVGVNLRRCFTHEFEIGTPQDDQRKSIILQAFPALSYLELPELVQQTKGLTIEELHFVCTEAILKLQTPYDSQEPEANIMNCVQSNLDQIKRTRAATELGTPQIPDIKWNDVGGLEDVKHAILDMVELPLKHQELFGQMSKDSYRRSGVLLYGPPGTGKTLLGKAVASECGIAFLSVKGPELINMYIGESERQIREVFKRAKQAAPCVLFFDELDALAPSRKSAGDSGGVMDRVVSQLLTELDGAHLNGLFIMGSTNRPDLVDLSLMRPGRLDQLLYVGIAKDPLSKQKILNALTRKFVLSTDVDLLSIAVVCHPNMTGADLYGVCADAWMAAAKRIMLVTEEPDGDVVVEQQDFKVAIAQAGPSLSEEEVQKYETLAKQYQNK
eukprot:TRINITY_DN6032_c2_g3_i1.p1 TRINITY_DN6032_c2_g3~~TRINITY_DN6032_c2_g3_i1.p1  ORF type:complete len:951 (+),score=92.14 TRINITY_DN6032_c2_g3_i1:36-2888(+)